MSEQPMIVRRPLGKTGIEVTPIGLGVMEFAGGGGFLGYAFPVIPQETKNEIVKAALDGGINWFDTAEMYGLGVSEQSTTEALKAAGKTRDDVVMATKWLPFLRTARNIPRTIDDRLRFLNGFNIDLYMIHQPWSFSSAEAEMDAMAGLVKAGKIRSVGVSNFNPERMRRAHAQLQKHGLPLAVNQVRYSLLDRSIETDGILDTARELDVTIISYTPLGSGLLSGKYHREPALVARLPRWRRAQMQGQIEATRPLITALEEIAAHHQVSGRPVTAAQVALNWVIHIHGETIVTIPGATKVHQARENAEAMHFQLTPGEIARLDELSRRNR